MKKNFSNYLYESLSVLLSLIVIIPIYLIVINSFKNQAEAAEMSLALPIKWNAIDNIIQVFSTSNIPKGFFNSVVLTLFSVIFLVLFSSIAAFVIQRRRNKFCDFLKKTMLAGISIPFSIVTTYLLMHKLKLTGTYIGMILLYVGTSFPFITYIYTGYFNGLPVEIDEAAVVDGCGGLRLFYQVIFPLLKPVNATAIIIVFMAVWNDFGTVIYFFNNTHRYTLTLSVYSFFGIYQSNWNLVFMDLLIVSLPIIIVYIFLQKYIISGMTAGAVKG